MLRELTANQQTVTSCLLRATKGQAGAAPGARQGLAFCHLPAEPLLAARCPRRALVGWALHPGLRPASASPRELTSSGREPRRPGHSPCARGQLGPRPGHSRGPARPVTGQEFCLRIYRALPSLLEWASFNGWVGSWSGCFFFFSFIHGSSQPLPGSPLDPGSCSFTEEPPKVTFRSCVLASASAHAFRRPLAGFLLTSARGNYHPCQEANVPASARPSSALAQPNPHLR